MQEHTLIANSGCLLYTSVLMIRKGSNRVEQLENSNSSFNLATAFVNEIIEDKERQMCQIVQILEQQQAINDKITSQVPVIVQKLSLIHI